MNYFRLTVTIAVFVANFVTIQARYLPHLNHTTLHSRNESVTNILSALTKNNHILSLARKKRPRPPKPCKKCGGGSDNDNDGEDGIDGDDTSGCFPSNAMVTLSTNQHVPISSISAGQSLKHADGSDSIVFGFSHRHHNLIADFTKLITSNGNLTVTKDHYIFSHGSHSKQVSLRKAGSLQIGDYLIMKENNMIQIQNVITVKERGLFNPHTTSGEFLVNGFRVSTFTTAVDPLMATSLLSPLRSLFKVANWDVLSLFFAYGCPSYFSSFCKTVHTLSKH